MGGSGGGFLGNRERQLKKIRLVLIPSGLIVFAGGFWSFLNGLGKGNDNIYLLIGIIFMVLGIVITNIAGFCAFGYSLSKKIEGLPSSKQEKIEKKCYEKKMDENKIEPINKLARSVAFKWILIPAVILIILNIVLVTVFSQSGLLKLFSGTVTGWMMIGLAVSWFIYAAFIQVFAIEPRVSTGQWRLPLIVNTVCTVVILLGGVAVGFSFFQ